MIPKYRNDNWIKNDITFCENKENCPLKNTCRRAQNPGPGIHSYSNFYDKYKKCEYYLTK